MGLAYGVRPESLVTPGSGGSKKLPLNLPLTAEVGVVGHRSNLSRPMVQRNRVLLPPYVGSWLDYPRRLTSLTEAVAV